MNVGVGALFTGALGLQSTCVVEDVKLDVPLARIDFEVIVHVFDLATDDGGEAANTARPQ